MTKVDAKRNTLECQDEDDSGILEKVESLKSEMVQLQVDEYMSPKSNFSRKRLHGDSNTLLQSVPSVFVGCPWKCNMKSIRDILKQCSSSDIAENEMSRNERIVERRLGHLGWSQIRDPESNLIPNLDFSPRGRTSLLLRRHLNKYLKSWRSNSLGWGHGPWFSGMKSRRKKYSTLVLLLLFWLVSGSKSCWIRASGLRKHLKMRYCTFLPLTTCFLDGWEAMS